MESQMTYIDPLMGTQNCSKLCNDFPKGCAKYCKDYIQPEVNVSTILSETSTIATSPQGQNDPTPYIIATSAAVCFLVFAFVMVCCFKEKIKQLIEKIRLKLCERHVNLSIEETAQAVVLIPPQEEVIQGGNIIALLKEPSAPPFDDTQESSL